jgi:hypothetical protein
VDHSIFVNIPESLDVPDAIVHDSYFLNGAATSVVSGVHPHISNSGCCGSFSIQHLWYNNVIDTVTTGQGWQSGVSETNVNFFFNNVITNANTNQRILNWAAPGVTMNFFNNSVECGYDSGSLSAGSCAKWAQAKFNVYNLHFIVNSGSPITCGQGYTACASFTTSAGTTTSAVFTSIPGNPSDIILQSKSAANALAYSYTQVFQFSPTSLTSPTVAKGVNNSAFCNQILDPAGSSACRQDTTYAVFYDKAAHAAVSSGRAPNARPSSGPWDVGAYQFSAGTQATVAPPTSLSATVQ